MRSLLFLFIVLFSSCLTVNKEVSKKQAENQKIVQQLFEHFNKHEWQKMASLYTETASFKDPSLGPGIVSQTQEQTTRKYTELHQIFPDIHDEVIQVYPSGEKHVIVEFVSTGTAPDGSKLNLPICTIFTLENGKIIKDFNYYDDFEE